MQNGTKGIILVISLLSAICISLIPFFASPVTVTPVFDTYVHSDYPTRNEEGATGVAVVTDTWDAHAWFTFSLSSIPDDSVITSAKLRLYSYQVVPAEGYWINIRFGPSWYATPITWNTEPLYGDWFEETWNVGAGGANRWYETTSTAVKDRVQQLLYLEDRITFVLEPDPEHPVTGTHLVNFYAMESTVNKPQLIIEYTEAPPPPEQYTLTVKAKDTAGANIRNAIVHADSIMGLTDYTGTCIISALTAGTYTVTVDWGGETKTETVMLDADKTVYFTFPAPPTEEYTLTVNVKDAIGTPLSGATIEVDTTTGSTDTTGIWQKTLPSEAYTVKVTWAGETKSQTVGLTMDKTVYFTFPAPGYTYSLALTVNDQVGHPLPATVTVDTTRLTCDEYGYASTTIATAPGETSMTATVTAEIMVGEREFSATKTITIDKDTVETITITRRFLWTFYVDYTDETLATGTLYTSGKESISTEISNGKGTIYLLNGFYTFTFEASPSVTLGSMTIANDGEFYATLTPEGEVEDTTSTEIDITEPTSPVTTPEIPWILIPSIYIYALLGVLMFGFIIAAIVRLRRPPK